MSHHGPHRSRPFLLFWSAETLSWFGDTLLLTALPLFVYIETASISATSVLFIAGAAPVVLLGVVAGVYVDRWNRKRALLACHAVAALAALALAMTSSHEGLWPTYAMTLMVVAAMRLARVAGSALAPTLVNRTRLTSANAVLLSGRSAAGLLGPASAGALMVVADFQVIALLVTGVFVLTCIILALTAVPTLTVSTEEAVRAANRSLSSMYCELAASLQLVVRSRPLAALVGICALCSFGEGVFGVLFVPFATTVLDGTEITVGSLLSLQAVGGVGGGVLLAKVGHLFRPATLLTVGALMLSAVDLLLINATSFTTPIGAALALMALAGLPATAFTIAFRTLIHVNVTSAHLGRIFGIVTTITGAFMVFGATVAGMFGERFGIVPMLHLHVLAYLIAGLIVLNLLDRFFG